MPPRRQTSRSKKQKEEEKVPESSVVDPTSESSSGFGQFTRERANEIAYSTHNALIESLTEGLTRADEVQLTEDLLPQYRVMLAPTGRAECKICAEKIPKGVVCVVVTNTHSLFDPRHHLDCVIFHTSLRSVDDIDGYSTLPPGPRKQVLDRYEISQTTVDIDLLPLDSDSLVRQTWTQPSEPSELITMDLLSYQKEGLGWMLHQEQESTTRGGILADEMGMGKTLQAVSLLMTHQPLPGTKGKQTLPIGSLPDSPSTTQLKMWIDVESEASDIERTMAQDRWRGGTLLVLPTSAIRQWQDEMMKYTRPGSLRYSVFHGDRRSEVSLEMLCDVDVVVTSYKVLEMEFRKLEKSHPGPVPCQLCGMQFARSLLPKHYVYCRLSASEKHDSIIMCLQDLYFHYNGMIQSNFDDDDYSDNNDNNDDDEDDLDDDDFSSSKKTLTKKAPVKKAPVKKAPVKKASVKKAPMKRGGKPPLLKTPHGKKPLPRGNLDKDSMENSEGESDAVQATPVPRVTPRGKRTVVKKELKLEVLGSDSEDDDEDSDYKDDSSSSEDSSSFDDSSSSNDSSSDNEPPSKKPKKLVGKPVPKKNNKRQAVPDLSTLSLELKAFANQILPEDKEQPPILSQDQLEFLASLAQFIPKSAERREVSKYLLEIDTIRRLRVTEEANENDKKRGKGNRSDKSTVSLLHAISWFRIILDEAHMIKDRSTSTARSAFQLSGFFKWCLTGTPLQNRVGELYSLVRFLRIFPHGYYFCKSCPCVSIHYQFTRGVCQACDHSSMQHYCHFNRFILNPIQYYGTTSLGRRSMMMLKHQILDHILLRRTKKTRAMDVLLPTRIVRVRQEHLNHEEEQFYTALYTSSQTQFNQYVEEDNVMNHYAHIFDLLMRLRQAVNHPYLVVYSSTQQEKIRSVLNQGGNTSTDVGVRRSFLDFEDGATARPEHTSVASVVASSSAALVYTETTPSMETNAIVSSVVEETEEQTSCPLCEDELQDPLRSHCGHVFCHQCVVHHLATTPGECPCCLQRMVVNIDSKNGEPIGTLNGLSTKRAPKSFLDRLNLVNFKSSTKLEALMQELHRMMTRDVGAKAIVFSQFVNMLDLIGHRIKIGGIKGVKLSGSQNVEQRERVLSTFRNDPECKVLLMSLKAGGVALNLTVASHIFLMDPWWNPAAEMQAIDRTHRIGQSKPIFATRFVTEGSIEERIVRLQEKKRLVFDSTVGGDANSLFKLTTQDLRFLFQ